MTDACSTICLTDVAAKPLLAKSVSAAARMRSRLSDISVFDFTNVTRGLGQLVSGLST